MRIPLVKDAAELASMAYWSKKELESIKILDTSNITVETSNVTLEASNNILEKKSTSSK